MKKKLAKYGNSSALVIDKPILQLLNIDETTELEITTDGESIVITPIKVGKKAVKRVSQDPRMQKIFEDTIKKYDLVFKKLSKN